jgi:hypothetical protein
MSNYLNRLGDVKDSDELLLRKGLADMQCEDDGQ